jgi:hypothetical protein
MYVKYVLDIKMTYTNVITVTAIIKDPDYDGNGIMFKLERTHIPCPHYEFNLCDDVFNKIRSERYIDLDGYYRNHEWKHTDDIGKELKEWVHKNNYSELPLWEALEKHFGEIDITMSPVMEIAHIHMDMQTFSPVLISNKKMK